MVFGSWAGASGAIGRGGAAIHHRLALDQAPDPTFSRFRKLTTQNTGLISKNTRTSTKAKLLAPGASKRKRKALTKMKYLKNVTMAGAALLMLGRFEMVRAAPMLYGSDRSGSLFMVDVATGSGTPVGGSVSVLGLSTEIEHDNIGGTSFSQSSDGAFEGNFFDIATGLPTSGSIVNGGSYTGLEYVGSTLYGAAIFGSGGPSVLQTLNPATGISVDIGPTGIGPVSGLAYDLASGTMYGITGGLGPAALYTIDLGTGLATPVGLTTIQAGSLEFGPDGRLYAGGTGTGGSGGNLYVVDQLTGASTLVGPTGFLDVTGLTLAPEADGYVWVLGVTVGAWGFLRHRRALKANS